MNDEEAYAIGARALAAGFKWMPGCLAVSSRKKYGAAVYICPDYDGKPVFCCLSPGAEPAAYDTMAPDVRDCGVIARILEQVRDRTGTPYYLARDETRHAWVIKCSEKRNTVPPLVGKWGKSQGEAVTLALEITHRGGF